MAGTSRIPHEGKEKSETLDEAKDKAKETASNLTQKAQDTVSGATDKAKEFASSARERAGEAAVNVGGKMSDLADTIRERAPHEGYVGRAAGAVADQLEAGGHYLQERGIEEMFADLGAVIRNHPLPSVLVILGVGYLLGKAMSRR
jgi:ElaB/YqjD/DUF883 family membrane-anchored ribosome-binding protein